jgi:hypothetical protein
MTKTRKKDSNPQILLMGISNGQWLWKTLIGQLLKKLNMKLGMVAHTYNPSYSRGRHEENHGWKPA